MACRRGPIVAIVSPRNEKAIWTSLMDYLEADSHDPPGTSGCGTDREAPHAGEHNDDHIVPAQHAAIMPNQRRSRRREPAADGSGAVMVRPSSG